MEARKRHPAGCSGLHHNYPQWSLAMEARKSTLEYVDAVFTCVPQWSLAMEARKSKRWGVTLLVDSRYQEGTTRRDVIETQEVHPGVQG